MFPHVLKLKMKCSLYFSPSCIGAVYRSILSKSTLMRLTVAQNVARQCSCKCIGLVGLLLSGDALRASPVRLFVCHVRSANLKTEKA